ncbi:hypothetical protein, partial [Glutamicibacter soli]
DNDINICHPMTFRAVTSTFPEVREKTSYTSGGDLSSRSYSKYFQSILAGKKLTPLKSRQKSSTPIQNLLKEAMKPKSLM